MNEMTIDKTNTTSYDMEGKCPFGGERIGGVFGSVPTLENWYPHRLRVELLHQNGLAADPLGPDFDYAAEFNKIDLASLKQDIKQFLTTSVPWWPSDYHNYGPQMIRMAWHSAGTYRIADGRGGAGTGMQRFAPISSWWDNGNTDKSRRLLQADQAQIRQRSIVGRPDGAHRQLRPRDHGAADLRLRRRQGSMPGRPTTRPIGAPRSRT